MGLKRAVEAQSQLVMESLIAAQRCGVYAYRGMVALLLLCMKMYVQYRVMNSYKDSDVRQPSGKLRVSDIASTP